MPARPFDKLLGQQFVKVTLLLLCVGCGGGNDTTVPVSGTITLQNGEPLPSATIMFRGTDGKTFTGGADGSGAYVARASEDSRGIAPGEYIVVVQESIGDDLDKPSRPKIHPRYGQVRTSDLKTTVSAEQPTYDFTLDPPGNTHRK
ncbi:carboxypeptidase-like regulatory domain-containing protein [Bythopirellula goksoeyrii]|uniref:Carboxypeptidase regulatory-like domain-containing protein n=1 Tax=Bythopirellula goksoeyrii TaxID=1400387 RepID=A0A5B9QCR8_9BACT|nr:carboxypeptidase-like regulatory domain-containing protein [Bythopirellula goksoeyrii]QEG35405.1 hypothetical protein Pr1d_27040 [Bythopirellula goksoeyrii]